MFLPQRTSHPSWNSGVGRRKNWNNWLSNCLLCHYHTHTKNQNVEINLEKTRTIKRKKFLLHYRLHRIFTAVGLTLKLSRHWFANVQVKVNIMGTGSSFATFLPLLSLKCFVIRSPSNTLFLEFMRVFSTCCGRMQACINICVLKDCMEGTCGRQEFCNCNCKAGSVPTKT